MIFQRPLTLALVAGALIACSSKPTNYQALSKDTDSNAAIESLQNQMQEDRKQQVDALAPISFEKAELALKDAQDARRKNKSTEKILEQVAIAKAYLQTAEERAKVSGAALGPVARARQSALAAQADSLAKKEYSAAEKRFQSLTEDAENGDLTAVEKNRDSIASDYRLAEIAAVKEKLLGKAKQTYDRAMDEGAKKYAPQTYGSVKSQIDKVAARIDKSPVIEPSLIQEATEAELAATQLLTTARNAKNWAGKTPEQIAVAMQAQNLQAQELAAQAEVQRLAAVDKDRALAASGQTIAALGEKLAPQQAYNEIRKHFTPAEADVMLEGDKVLVRLKSLSFESNKSEIRPQQYSLLKKLGDSIGGVHASKVVIEGHTDAVGNAAKNQELSSRRAEAVGQYLATNSVESEKVSTVGYGYSKPISDNKSKSGRAANRRIDVVIEL